MDWPTNLLEALRTACENPAEREELRLALRECLSVLDATGDAEPAVALARMDERLIELAQGRDLPDDGPVH